MTTKNTKLGKKVDALLNLKAKITINQKKVDELKSTAAKMVDDLIEELEDAGVESFGTKIGTVRLNSKNTGTVKDWEKFYKFIVKEDAFELLQKRISQFAYIEHCEAAGKIPGVINFVKKSLTFGRKKKA